MNLQAASQTIYLCISSDAYQMSCNNAIYIYISLFTGDADYNLHTFLSPPLPFHSIHDIASPVVLAMPFSNSLFLPCLTFNLHLHCLYPSFFPIQSHPYSPLTLLSSLLLAYLLSPCISM